MKLEYFADTDSLSITFRDQPSVDSTELSAGVVADYDADGRVVGIDIDNASRKVDLTRVVLNRLPGPSGKKRRPRSGSWLMTSPRKSHRSNAAKRCRLTSMP